MKSLHAYIKKSGVLRCVCTNSDEKVVIWLSILNLSDQLNTVRRML